MDRIELIAAIENILFLSEHAVTVDQFVNVLGPGIDPKEVQDLLEELVQLYQSRGLQIQQIGGGYRMCTREEYAEWVQKFHRLEKSSKLSRASIETLSIIAYKQPITRAEIEEIRGVDSLGVLKTIINHNLVKILGRKKVPGRPVIYGTTKRFLEYFGLASLSEMPTLQEFEKIAVSQQQELLLDKPLEDQEGSEDTESSELEPAAVKGNPESLESEESSSHQETDHNSKAWIVESSDEDDSPTDPETQE